MASKNKKIVISGYYGFGNFGDEAILSAAVRELNRNIPNLSMSVLSNSKSTYLSDEFDVKCIGRTSLFAIVREILSADLFISGGGGLIQDSSGVSTVMYYLGLVRLAKMLGRRVMFYAQGLGPVGTSQGKNLVKSIVNKVDLITVRDNESRDLFRELGAVKPPIIVTADPVIALKGSSPEKIFEKEGLTAAADFNVAVSVRSWDTSFDFISLLASTADKIIERYGARIILIPFQKSQDLSVCEKIASLMKNKPFILKGDYKPEEMIGFIGSMDFLLAMRLHALIFASSSKLPMAGIVYDPKVEIFSRSLDIPHWPLEELEEDSILEVVESVKTDKNTFRDKMSKNIAPYYESSLLTAKVAADFINGMPAEQLLDKYGR